MNVEIDVKVLKTLNTNGTFSLPLRGSQTSFRGLTFSRWQKGGNDRLYINLKIGSKRISPVAYIDLVTGEFGQVKRPYELENALIILQAIISDSLVKDKDQPYEIKDRVEAMLAEANEDLKNLQAKMAGKKSTRMSGDLLRKHYIKALATKRVMSVLFSACKTRNLRCDYGVDFSTDCQSNFIVFESWIQVFEEEIEISTR